jgi:hypothetical protein
MLSAGWQVLYDLWGIAWYSFQEIRTWLSLAPCERLFAEVHAADVASSWHLLAAA